MPVQFAITQEATRQICREMEGEISDKIDFCYNNTFDAITRSSLQNLAQRARHAVVMADAKTIIQIDQFINESYEVIAKSNAASFQQQVDERMTEIQMLTAIVIKDREDDKELAQKVVQIIKPVPKSACDPLTFFRVSKIVLEQLASLKQ